MKRALLALLAICYSSAPARCAEPASAGAGAADSPTTIASWASFPPFIRFDHSAAYDSKRRRMIVFAGWDGSSRTHETWAFSFEGKPRWNRLAPEDGAPAIDGSALLYDPVRDQVVVLFGNWGGFNSDVWTLSLRGTPRWSKVQVIGDPPNLGQRVYGYGQPVYDVLRDRVLVVWSGAYSDTLRDGVYSLVFQDAAHARWDRLTNAVPRPLRRIGFGATYDVAGDRLVLFGGGMRPRGCFDFGNCLKPLNDTWTLDLRGSDLEWSELEPSGAWPDPRAGVFAAYDLARRRVVVYGGHGLWEQSFGDSWELSLGERPEWRKLPADLGSRAPTRESVVWDSDHERLVQFGGIVAARRASAFTGSGGVSGLVRVLSLPGAAAWETVDPFDPTPSARTGHTLTYDPLHRRWILFGGAEDDSAVWALSERGNLRWLVLPTIGEGPSARAFQSAIYDSATRSLVIFGGLDLHTFAVLGDIWRLSLGGTPTWSRIEAGGTAPGPRAWHGAIDDPIGRRMIVFGGRMNDFHASDELWQLSLDPEPIWTRIEAAGDSPGPLSDLLLVYDSNRGRAILVSGSSSRRDVWSLDLTDPPSWMRMTQDGPLIHDDGAIFDPQRDRVLALEGYRDNEPWELQLSPTVVWRPIPVTGQTPPGRSVAPIALGDRADEIILFGGGGSSYSLPDLWTLSLPRKARAPVRSDAEVAEQISPFLQASLSVPYPNPSCSGVVIAYTQPTRAHVTIHVLDCAGRLVRKLVEGMSEAGSHEVTWNGLREGGSRAGAGVYYCAMSVGDWSASRKLVLFSP